MRSPASLPPEANVRVDSSTTFAVVTARKIEWDRVPQLRGAYVRIWLRGAPTSITSTELWGNARLVVVDSFSAEAAEARPGSQP